MQLFDLNPMFVHASPRSGSTYFFNVLRRSRSLMCFNEAIIDVFGYYGKKEIAHFGKDQKWNVNHHFLDHGEFDEFVDAWHAVMHLYPPFPSFQSYLPENGRLPSELLAYLGGLMQYAQAHDKRPVLCEIHSRGRAGALRGAFAGFHIAQVRDPLSQFGSFVRPLVEGGEWGFLTFPLMELGISGAHPLYRLVPEDWRVPILPWPAHDRAQRWASAAQYIAMVASPDAESTERLLRWHLFSWMLSNLAAVCYSDFVLDIDKTHDNTAYRRLVCDTLASECGVVAEFNDLEKFVRYYRFEGLDVASVCDQVASVIMQTLSDGRIEIAVRALGIQEPKISATQGVRLLLEKLRGSQVAMAASTDCNHVSASEWQAIAGRHRHIWFSPAFRAVAQRVYPLAAPFVRAARRVGIFH